MKFLFDENLSPKLVASASQDFPGSTHVEACRLRGSSDRKIWDHALDNGFAIVSKDSDFRERSALEGFPPKVIWLNVGNAGTVAIAELMSRKRSDIIEFDRDAESSFLVLSFHSTPA